MDQEPYVVNQVRGKFPVTKISRNLSIGKSYIGVSIQDILSGNLIDDSKTAVDGIATYDFTSIRYFWIVAAALSFILCASLWKVKAKTGTE